MSALHAFVLLSLAIFVLTRRRAKRASQGSATVSARDAVQGAYPYVYVNEDGSVRELSADERRYLETPFRGSDGARPWVKWRYGSRTPTGSFAGFCRRGRVPKDALSGSPKLPGT